jgi:very-short-patch-repair endonuclease
LNPLLSRWRKLYAGTRAELVLEEAVASLGVPYRFSHPVWGARAFLDLALLGDKVDIEVDGDSHNRPAQKAKDEERTARLEALGWRVVRCTNAEAVEDPYGTVDRLVAKLGLPYRTRRPLTRKS